MRNLNSILFAGTLSAVSLSLCAIEPFNTERNTNGPMSAAQVVADSRLPEGFRLTVVASEPEVQQPIAMATDTRGRLWVAENYTYSETSVGFHPELRDRILWFEDSDGDGQFDRRTIFSEGHQRLTSVEVGLGGVWVLALPELWFIPDADGDGVADGPAQVVLDGFEYVQGHHTVANGLRWGPDGWLYGRHGIQSTSLIGRPGTPQKERVAMNVGIWRYHPSRKVVEIVAQGTTNPWGMDWDSHGEMFFINTVIGHLWHVIPGAHYRRMYGEDPTPNIYEVIEQHADHVHWARGENWTDVREGVSDVTSAAGGGHAHTGLLIYQGGQWPSYWNDKVITLNFHGRRFNVERMEPHGSGYVGRHEPDAVFFADPWFRGIDLIASPEGGVLICDWSDAGECHDHDGVHRTSGRVYHLTYGENRGLRSVDVSALSEADLAQLQTDSNDWYARQARRVLAERAVTGQRLDQARLLLEGMTRTENLEIVRLRALWALHVSGGVNEGLLREKWMGGTESERVWALRLLEEGWAADPSMDNGRELWIKNELPELAVTTKSARVRLALASLLQRIPMSDRPALATALLSRGEDAGDHNLPLMLWYGIEPLAMTVEPFVEMLAHAQIPRVQGLGARRLAQEYDEVGARVNALLIAMLEDSTLDGRRAVLDGLIRGFAGRRQVSMPDAWKIIQERWGLNSDQPMQDRLQELGVVFGEEMALNRLRALAREETAEISRRQKALQRLVDVRASGLRALCEELLTVEGLGVTAATGLAMYDESGVADRVLSEWPRFRGEERAALVSILITRPVWAMKLLDAMAAGEVDPKELGVAQARQIASYKQPKLQEKLTEVWGALREPDETARRVAMDHWRARLTDEAVVDADLIAGRQMYGISCGACHRLYGEGGDLGPDLTGSGRQNLDYLLENILFPHAVVPAGFRQSTLVLSDGRVLSGIIRERTPQALTLAVVGETLTIHRAEIETEETAEQSMMPEGLLDALTEEQVIQLFAYLMSSRPVEE